MIRTEKLSVHYGAFTAVRNASLSVKQGSITAIVGPSGCGKSSFLSALNRMTDLIPSARITGKVMIDCCDIHDQCRSPAELRRCVGMIFQKPNPFPMSIRRNIELALREHGTRDRAELKSITERVLTDVGLWEEVCDRLDMPALQLSGGQQQRLCIARALALQPQVLLMDEPCSALDPIASAKVESLITSLRGRYTIVIVTHNLAQARRIGDDLAVFWVNKGAGEIIEQGPAEDVFETPSHSISAAYLSGTRG
ncbi:MAG: phosphate ABC transporter ATP-binding protein [Fuerstiella sp.]